MRIKDFELEAKTFDNLTIELEDEYMYMNFYKYQKADFNYIKRRYEENYSKSGYYVGLYEDESIHCGYFYIYENMLLKAEHIYPKHTRYMELLEFGFNKNNVYQANLFVDYLYYYCQSLGANFLKVKTTEKVFNKFYELLKKFKYTVYKEYMYIEIAAKEFENLKHLKPYKGDKLSFKDLYHLNEIGFDFDVEKGVLVLPDGNRIEINRKTKKITYPLMVKNLSEDSKFNYFNYDSCALVHYIKSHFYDIENHDIELDYKIKGFENRELIKIGQKLITLEKGKYIDDYQIKDEIVDFAKAVCENTNIISMDVIMDCGFRWKNYYASLSSIWIYLPKYVYGEEEVEEY